MAAPIEFYFDFSSPYGYFAAFKIDEIAARHGRKVNWRPMLLGAVFKITGMAPLLNYPIKGDYMKHDWERFSRLFALKWQLPAQFPFVAVNPSRAFYWLHDRDAELAKRFAKAAYQRAFGDGQEITSAEATAAAGEAVGVARAELVAAINDAAVKDRLRQEVDAAIAAKIFGSPTFVIDGEPFWGADRLDQVERWLTTGGW